MVAARLLGIKTATFVYSWDNIAKGAFAFTTDHYLVWSERMFNELLDRYEWITPEQVHVLGTPQFEPHLDTTRIRSREEFCDELGLNPEKPIVLFSGDDVATSPHDPTFLEDVAKAILTHEHLNGTQLIFRRCPADLSSRYDSVLEKYPWIVISEPRWTTPNGGAWNDAIPTNEDLTLLSNIVTHCATTVNVGSTVAMDFAVLDKPAIWLDYNPDPTSTWYANSPYSYPHFDSVRRHDPIHWVRSRSQIQDTLIACLASDDGKSANRHSWLQEELTLPVKGTSLRFIDAIKELVSK